MGKPSNIERIYLQFYRGKGTPLVLLQRNQTARRSASLPMRVPARRARHDGCYEASTMTRGAISKIIDKLQAKGWIRSKVNPEDNRGQLLSLTPVGRRNLPELAEIADQNDEQFFACLNADQRTALKSLLSRLAEHHQIRDVPVE